MRPPVKRIGNDPARGNVCVECSREHPLRQLDLGREASVLRNACLGPAPRVVDPFPRQIQGTVDERGTILRGIGQEDADLAVHGVPAVPVYWRATPQDFFPFFRKPVSSTMRTPVASSPRCATT